jgi:hypothetical protein
MNTLVIGDSWGTVSPWGHAKYNTESQTSINISVMGKSNIDSLFSAQNFLWCNEIKIDLIVWYFTSLLRNAYPSDELPTFKHYLDNLNLDVLNRVELIRKEFPEIKWAIIGGHSPIHDVQKYEWANLIIEDWRSELIGEKIPPNQSLGMYNALEYIKSKSPQCTDDIIRELDIEKKIIDLGKIHTPNIFTDEVHPNLTKGHELCDRILNYFMQSG